LKGELSIQRGPYREREIQSSLLALSDVRALV